MTHAVPASANPAPRPRPQAGVMLAAAVLILAACAPTPEPRAVPVVPLAQSALTAPMRTALAERAYAHDMLLMQANLPALRHFHPPRMADRLARETEHSLARMIAASRIYGEASPGVLVVGRMMTDEARIGSAGDGSLFALIPTRTLIAFGRTGGHGAATMVQGTMLAFPEAGQWYFLRLTDTRNEDALRRAYPQFRGIALPRPAEGTS